MRSLPRWHKCPMMTGKDSGRRSIRLRRKCTVSRRKVRVIYQISCGSVVEVVVPTLYEFWPQIIIRDRRSVSRFPSLPSRLRRPPKLGMTFLFNRFASSPWGPFPQPQTGRAKSNCQPEALPMSSRDRTPRRIWLLLGRKSPRIWPTFSGYLLRQSLCEHLMYQMDGRIIAPCHWPA